MKRIITISFLLTALVTPLWSFAQGDKNLKKTVIDNIVTDNFSYVTVKQGEFRVNYDEYVYDKINTVNVYKYFVIVRDELSGKEMYVQTNNRKFDMSNKDKTIDLLRIGYDMSKYVYIEENTVPELENLKNKYFFVQNGNKKGPFNKITDVLHDGIVAEINGTYFYHAYDDEFGPSKIYVVADKENYTSNKVEYMLNGKKMSFEPINEVFYFKSSNGQYYLYYKDDFMNNTLLVVDSIGYELCGNEKPKFNFSHDGSHWIAASDNFVMVDGVIVGNKHAKLKDILVKNNGEYINVEDGDGFSDKIYLNGKLFADGIDVLYIAIDDNERLNYVCKNRKACYYCMDNEIHDMSKEMKEYYYPHLVDDNKNFIVKSDDGKHVLKFSYDSPFVEIDGKKILCESAPHYAIWHKKTKSFKWNSVESKNLVVYTYKVR